MIKVKVGVIETKFNFDISTELKNPYNVTHDTMKVHGDYVVDRIKENIKQYKEIYGIDDLEVEMYALPVSPNALVGTVVYDLDIVNLSRTHSGANNLGWEKQFKERDRLLVAAAGNDGAEKEEFAASHDHWLAVGALQMDGKTRTDYSSYGLGDVFTMKQGNYDINDDGEPDVKGTSFACPDLVGEMVFYYYFWKKYNKEARPDGQRVHDFIKRYSVDIEKEGKDMETGWGVFNLPDKNTMITEVGGIQMFKDINESDWYYDAVKYVQEKGLMAGYEDGTFKPNEPITRAELAQVLYNMNK